MMSSPRRLRTPRELLVTEDKGMATTPTLEDEFVDEGWMVVSC